MSRQSFVPEELKSGPFTVDQARSAGVSRRMLVGKQFVRVFPRVWRWVGRPLPWAGQVAAARLSLPDDAAVTGITRIRLLGLDHGAMQPLHFVIARDYHLDVDGIMLHRTDRMPWRDGIGVSPTAAFVAYCVDATVMDAVIVGDWLLAEGHMTLAGLRRLAHYESWRAGMAKAVWVSELLDGRSRSPAESRLRVCLIFAGLPVPGVNTEVWDSGRLVAIVDLDYLLWSTVIEYEGGQHQTDRGQYLRDIGRYADLRKLGLTYVQVTKEVLSDEADTVRRIHRALLANGYRGPDPEFGTSWRMRRARIPSGPGLTISGISVTDQGADGVTEVPPSVDR